MVGATSPSMGRPQVGGVVAVAPFVMNGSRRRCDASPFDKLRANGSRVGVRQGAARGILRRLAFGEWRAYLVIGLRAGGESGDVYIMLGMVLVRLPLGGRNAIPSPSEGEG